jgi:hypothetical protein
MMAFDDKAAVDAKRIAQLPELEKDVAEAHKLARIHRMSL